MLFLGMMTSLFLALTWQNWEKPFIVSIKKRLAFEATLAYNRITNDPWYSPIRGTNIILGALPLEQHREELRRLNITWVLAVVEDFELEPWQARAIQPSQWEKMGVKVVWRIRAQDFHPLTEKEISQGVHILGEALQRNETAYVHCKAGKGRSAGLVIAHLAINKRNRFSDAHGRVKVSRPQISLSDYQYRAVRDFVSKQPGL
jgi:protein-tyrosine phosphatase